MAITNLTKRTIWVAECDCRENEGEKYRVEYTDNPPRETKCPHCHTWIEPVEVSYTGQDTFNNKT